MSKVNVSFPVVISPKPYRGIFVMKLMASFSILIQSFGEWMREGNLMENSFAYSFVNLVLVFHLDSV